MEAILVILALAIVLLPVISLIMVMNTKSTLEKRIAALEREIGLLRTQGALPVFPAAPQTAPPAVVPAKIAPTEVAAGAPIAAAAPPIASTDIPGTTESVPEAAPADVDDEKPEEGDIEMIPQPPPAPAAGGRPSARNRPAPPRIPGTPPGTGPALTATPGVPRPAAPRPAPKPSRTKAEWEALLGGQVLNRIGALAIIIGVGFFLKYAFDKEWITEEMRTAIGAVTGILLLLIGKRAHRKEYVVFSQGLVGAGIAILYLTVYAAFGLYDMGISQTVAFLLMSAVTVLAFQQAFHYNSLAVSLLGLFGGFLTPVMLSTGSVNAPGLFTYLSILNAGLIAITMVKRGWKVLEPLAFACTYLYYFIWFGTEMTAAQSGLAAIFLGIFWLLFQIPDSLRAIRNEGKDVGLPLMIGGANGVLLLSGMMAIADQSRAIHPAVVAVIIGIVYLALMTFPGRRNGSSGNRSRTTAFITDRNALLGVAALTIAVWQYPFPGPEYFYNGLVMSLLALLLFWWGAHRNQTSLWMPAIFLFVNALIFAYGTEPAAPMVTIGPFPLPYTLISQFAVVAALLLALRPARLIDREKTWPVGLMLDYAWPLVLTAAITLLTMYTYVLHASPAALAGATYWHKIDYGSMAERFPMLMTLVLVWLAGALALIWTGLRLRRLPLLHCGLGILALATVLGVARGASYLPLEEFTLAMNIRFVTLLAVVAGVMLSARWLSRNRERHTLPSVVIGALQICGVLILLELLTVEAADAFNSRIQIAVNAATAANQEMPWGLMTDLRNWEQLTISGIWLLYSAALMVAGILRRMRPLRVIAFVLFGFTILKIFVYDLSFLDTLYRIFSFIGLGVILLGISFLFQRFRDVIFGTDGETAKAAVKENPTKENPAKEYSTDEHPVKKADGNTLGNTTENATEGDTPDIPRTS